jgi:hypothetical protein
VIGLDQTMDVYTRDGNGRFTVLANEDVACHFYHVRAAGGNTTDERAQLTATRNLHWDYDVVLPEYDRCRLKDEGDLWWAPVTGTYEASTAFGMPFRRCDVKRVPSNA